MAFQVDSRMSICKDSPWSRVRPPSRTIIVRVTQWSECGSYEPCESTLFLFYMCMDSMRSVVDGCVMTVSTLFLYWVGYSFVLRFENDNLYWKKKRVHILCTLVVISHAVNSYKLTYIIYFISYYYHHYYYIYVSTILLDVVDEGD